MPSFRVHALQVSFTPWSWMLLVKSVCLASLVPNYHHTHRIHGIYVYLPTWKARLKFKVNVGKYIRCHGSNPMGFRIHVVTSYEDVSHWVQLARWHHTRCCWVSPAPWPSPFACWMMRRAVYGVMGQHRWEKALGCRDVEMMIFPVCPET